MQAELQATADQLALPNEYGSLIERQGGIGLNAQTSQDATGPYIQFWSYHYRIHIVIESHHSEDSCLPEKEHA